MEPIAAARVSRSADVTWREAEGSLYVFAVDQRKVFRLDDASVVEVKDDELRRVFGDSDTNVIRVCNMI